MSWSQEDLDKLDKAIVSGARRVEFKDYSVEYRSLSEMWQARKAIADSLSSDDASSPNISRFIGSKGV